MPESADSIPAAKDCSTEEILNNNWFTVLKVLNTNEILYSRSSQNPDLDRGDHVIIPTKFGLDLAEVIGKTINCNGCKSSEHSKNSDEVDLIEIDSVASEQDRQEYRVNLEKAREAFSITQDLIRQHNLNMKLVKVHFVLRESRIVFFFTSDKRVDFRSLVRDLVSHFRARIELRQIGVRDESRMIGGRGVCGRKLCCSAVAHELEPVSIKMAKVQKLSLNSQKISGPCGRLLCCLAYEFEAYQSEQKSFPREGQWLTAGGERLRITEVNILSKRVVATDREGLRRDFSRNDIQYTSEKNTWKVSDTAKQAVPEQY